MKRTTLSAALLALTMAFSANGRTYIAERGDTWESVARKWGLYTEELKAANSIFPELFTGLEIELPEQSAKEPLGTRAIARLELAGRNLDKGKELLERKEYSLAETYFTLVESGMGRPSAELLYLRGRIKEETKEFENAHSLYKKALAKGSEGDPTMTGEQYAALTAKADEIGVLAAKQRLKREEEARRRREEAEREAAREAERSAARRRAAAERQTTTTSNRGGGGGWGWPFSGWGAPSFGWSAPVPLPPMPAPMPMPTPSFQNVPSPSWGSVPMDWNTWSSVPMDAGASFSAPLDGGDFSTGSGNPRDPITFSDHQCNLCGGKGTIADSGATTLGQSGSKYCSDCGRYVDLSHRHIQCPSCQGKGTVRKRD